MGSITFAAFTAEILELYESESARGTYRKMRQVLREFARIPEIVQTSDLTDLAIVRWKKLFPERGSWTRRSLLISFRRAVNLALAKGYIERSPFKVRSLNDWAQLDEPPDVGHHGLESIGRVLGHLAKLSSESWADARLHALAATVAYTGVRAGEAKHARVEDFDLDRGIIVISNRRKLKTRKSAQPVPIPPDLAPILEGWLPRTGGQWAFPGVRKVGPWTGGPPGHKPLDRLKSRALEVGVSGFTFQSLRHSWATHAEGPWEMTDPQIARVLRHTTIRTSKLHYRHADIYNLKGIGRKVSIPVNPPR